MEHAEGPNVRMVQTALGYVLLGLAAFGTAVLVDLVRDGTSSGSVELTVFGASLGSRSGGSVLIITASLAAVCGALVISGMWALAATRRRRRDQGRERLVSESHRLETVRRLLEERVDLLAASARELEERQTELRQPMPSSRPDAERRVPVPGTAADEVIELPEAPE